MPWEMKEKLDAKLAKEAAGLKYVVAPTNCTFLIKVDFDAKVEKAAMADPLLRKDFDDAGQDTIGRFVEFVGLKMKSTNELVGKLLLANKVVEAQAMKEKMNKDIEQMRGSAQQFGVQQVQNAWTSLGKKKKEYTKYKIKIVVTISAAAAGLAASIAGLAASGFSGGASGALGIIGMVNSVVTISKEVVAAGMEVETAAKTLVVQLKAVEAAFKASVAGAHVNEITGAILQKFIGISQPSIKSCDDWMGRCEQKLNGVEIKNHQLAENIQKLINTMPTFEEKFLAEAAAYLKKNPNPKAIDQLGVIKKNYHKAVDAAEVKIQECSKELLGQIDRFKAAKVSVEELKKRVDAIKKFRGGPYKLLDNLLIVTDVLLSPLSGNSLVRGAANIAQNVVPCVTLLAVDRITKIATEGTVLE
ncbi:MAG TPA: hypothetical protein VMB03_11565 [Bryobacteraceae bacterium]|nr:hypothetical protein [Bryobacteraceae bacterium]